MSPLHTLVLTRKGYPFRTPFLGYVSEIPAMKLPDDQPAESPMLPVDLNQLAQVLQWASPVQAGARITTIRLEGIAAPSRFEQRYIQWLAQTLNADVQVCNCLLSPAQLANMQTTDCWPTATGASGPAAVAEMLDLAASRFWSHPDQIPQAVGVLRAETLRGEARFAAQSIRRWLFQSDSHKGPVDQSLARRLDDVLVLLPATPGYQDVWAEVLTEHDLPVNTTTFRSLASVPFAQWVLDLAQLAGWSDTQRKSRDLLQRVLMSRFWSVTAVRNWLELPKEVTFGRPQLAKILASVRRPSLTLEEWRNHLLTDQNGPAGEAAWRMSLAIATTLSGPDLGQSLSGLLNGPSKDRPDLPKLGVKGALHRVYAEASRTAGATTDLPNSLELDDLDSSAEDRDPLDVEESADADVREETGPKNELASVFGAVQKVLATLPSRVEEDLALRTQSETGTADAAGPSPELAASLLESAMRDRSLTEFQDHRHGVRLLSYDHYDFRHTTLLFMAGLGEGQYPTVPPLPTAHSATWLANLGLLAADEGPSDWVSLCAEQQIRNARAALQHAEQVVMSFSAQGSGTGQTHPGGLLTLLCGSWPDDVWKGKITSDNVHLVTAGAVIPKSPSQAGSRLEARLFGHRPQFRQSLESLSMPVAGEVARQLRQTESDLETSRMAQAERQGDGGLDESGSAAFGAFTGRLPGAIHPASPDTVPHYSPTSLEVFGQCPYKYFLDKVLRLKSEGDADDSPDAREMGTTIHTAFADAARQAISASPEAIWDLSFPDSEDVDQLLRNRHQAFARHMPVLSAAIERAIQGLGAQQPTLSGPLLAAIRVRWQQALGNWLLEHLQPAIPVETDDVSIEAHPPVAMAVEHLRSTIETATNMTNALADEVRQGGYTTKKNRLEPMVGDMMKACGATGKKKALVDQVWPRVTTMKGQSPQQQEELLQECVRVLISGLTGQAQKVRDVAFKKEQDRRLAVSLMPKVAYAEFSFGRPDSGDGSSDPASVPTPLTVSFPDGRSVAFNGQIDRIDWDRQRNRLAVRDYKSGKKKGAEALERQIRLGLHLQLLLYASAVHELLVHSPNHPAMAGAEVVLASLEFPKSAGESIVSISQGLNVPADAPGEDHKTLSFADVLKQWLQHFTGCIQRGQFDLYPQACPILHPGKAYCDFSAMCGLNPKAAERFASHPERPNFPYPPEPPKPEKPKSDKEGKNHPTPTFIALPDVNFAPGNEAEARKAHAAGMEAAVDLNHNVMISAGAGSGKTYNLVRRYQAALDAGCSPEEILCVTFTRKAAAEMKQRVRAKLMGEAQIAAEKSPGSKPSLESAARQRILMLSSAPILTIDSLGLHLLTILHEAKLERDGVATTPAPSISDAGGDLDVGQFVAERFLDALANPTPEFQKLLSDITVDKLRGQLESVAKSVTTLPESAWPMSAKELIHRWESLVAPLAQMAREYARDFVKEIKLDEGQRFLNLQREEFRNKPPKNPNVEGNLDEIQTVIDNLRKLASGSPLSVSRVAELVSGLDRIPCTKGEDTQGYIGSGALREWVSSKLAARSFAEVAFGPTCVLAEPFKCLGRAASKLDDLAETTFNLLQLGRSWGEELRSARIAKGALQFADVETLLLKVLSCDDPDQLRALPDASLLAQRIQFKHIFVDESQDTSERQVTLLRRLAALTGAKTFWVGDAKQSIYLFRGAEVDVFEELVHKAQNDPEVTLASLCENRRSDPPLLDTFNTLFSCIFQPRFLGTKLSQGPEIPFEPQTWPADKGPQSSGSQEGCCKKRACIEIILDDSVPQANAANDPFAQNSTDQSNEDDDGEADESEGKAGWEKEKWGKDERTKDESGSREKENRKKKNAEENDEDGTKQEVVAISSAQAQALAIRISELLADPAITADNSPTDGTVAILVSSWAAANRWRDELAVHGIACAVQGGSGLLTTPEILHLRLWLEEAVRQDDVSLAGMLKGPGIGLSDAGLFCLRMGFGMRLPDGTTLSTADGKPVTLRRALMATLDPSVAVAAWKAHSGQVDLPQALALLQADSQSLARFQKAWGRFASMMAASGASVAVQDLIQQLGLDAFWAADEVQGRQAVANLQAFIDMLREAEQSLGASPQRLLNYLDTQSEGDDPASGGLDATSGTQVIATTFWQAKGREWPVVVLPGIENVKDRADASGLALKRLVTYDPRTDQRTGVVYATGPALTSDSAPFDATIQPLSELLKVYPRLARKAELWRLFYVAMTRAKHRVVLLAKPDLPKLKERLQEFTVGGSPQPATCCPDHGPDSGKAADGTAPDAPRFKATSMARAATWAQLLMLALPLENGPAADTETYKPLGPELESLLVGNVQAHKRGLFAYLAADRTRLLSGEFEVNTTSDLLAQHDAPKAKPACLDDTISPDTVTRWTPVPKSTVLWMQPSEQKPVAVLPPPADAAMRWPGKRPVEPDCPLHANEAGIAYHRLMELWGYGANGVVLDADLARLALEHTGLWTETHGPAIVLWMLAVAQIAMKSSPALAETLRQASAQGQLFHEVRIQYPHASGKWVQGSIDLLWKDAQGWHLLDYKTGKNVPTLSADRPDQDPTRHQELRKYYAQIDVYRQGLSHLLGEEKLVDMGLWYVGAGFVVRWKMDDG